MHGRVVLDVRLQEAAPLPLSGNTGEASEVTTFGVLGALMALVLAATVGIGGWLVFVAHVPWWIRLLSAAWVVGKVVIYTPMVADCYARSRTPKGGAT